MLKKILYLLIVMAAFNLSGCASNASSVNMIYSQPVNSKLTNPLLKRAIVVKEVTGGEETNPLWISKIDNEDFKKALEQSLDQAELFGSFDHAKYELTARLVSVNQPMIGIDFTVRCIIHYTLHDIATNKTIYGKDVFSSYTATFGDSPAGIIRMRLANEGAAKANIKELMTDLYKLPKNH